MSFCEEGPHLNNNACDDQEYLTRVAPVKFLGSLPVPLIKSPPMYISFRRPTLSIQAKQTPDS